MAVVDASVFISAILPNDINHNASKVWFDSLFNTGGFFFTPTIFLSEIAAPLSRAHNQPNLAKHLVQSLMNSPIIKLQPVTDKIASRAGIIATDYKIRGCDAIYVALAEALNEDLLTWDKQQRERAKPIINAYHP
jgi:predicted nucleic acid-binding protein